MVIVTLRSNQTYNQLKSHILSRKNMIPEIIFRPIHKLINLVKRNSRINDSMRLTNNLELSGFEGMN